MIVANPVEPLHVTGQRAGDVGVGSCPGDGHGVDVECAGEVNHHIPVSQPGRGNRLDVRDDDRGGGTGTVKEQHRVGHIV